eukprot:PhF_6_TR13199/c0_g1_i2/m.20848
MKIMKFAGFCTACLAIASAARTIWNEIYINYSIRMDVMHTKDLTTALSSSSSSGSSSTGGWIMLRTCLPCPTQIVITLQYDDSVVSIEETHPMVNRSTDGCVLTFVPPCCDEVKLLRYSYNNRRQQRVAAISEDTSSSIADEPPCSFQVVRGPSFDPSTREFTCDITYGCTEDMKGVNVVFDGLHGPLSSQDVTPSVGYWRAHSESWEIGNINRTSRSTSQLGVSASFKATIPKTLLDPEECVKVQVTGDIDERGRVDELKPPLNVQGISVTPVEGMCGQDTTELESLLQGNVPKMIKHKFRWVLQL